MLLFFELLLKGQTFPFNYMHDLLGRQNGKMNLNRFFLLFNLAQGCHERLGNVTALTILLHRILVPYHSFAPFLIIALAVFFLWEGVIQRGDGANEAPKVRASRVIRGHASPENFKNKVL